MRALCPVALHVALWLHDPARLLLHAAEGWQHPADLCARIAAQRDMDLPGVSRIQQHAACLPVRPTPYARPECNSSLCGCVAAWIWWVLMRTSSTHQSVTAKQLHSELLLREHVRGDLHGNQQHAA